MLFLFKNSHPIMYSQVKRVCCFKQLASFLAYAPEVRRHKQQVFQRGIVKSYLKAVLLTVHFFKKSVIVGGMLVLREYLILYDAFQLFEVVVPDSDLDHTAVLFKHTGVFVGHKQGKHRTNTVELTVGYGQARSCSNKKQDVLIS